MSGKPTKTLEIQKLLKARQDLVAEQLAMPSHPQDKKPHIAEGQLANPASIMHSLETQLKALEKNSAEKNHKAKRGREEKAQPSSGKEKRRLAATSSSPHVTLAQINAHSSHSGETTVNQPHPPCFSPLPTAPLTNTLINTPSISSSNSFATPDIDDDEMSEESDLFKLELDSFIEAAAANEIGILRLTLKGSTYQQKTAFISTPASTSCKKFKGLTALEIVVDRNYKKAIDTMLDFLLLKDIMVVISKVWHRIEKHPKAPTNEKRSRWQDLRAHYQALKNLADAVLKNDQGAVKKLLLAVESKPEILHSIITKPIQTKRVSKSVTVSGSFLKIAIRNGYEEIAWLMLDALSIDDAKEALTTISRENGARIFLIANLTSRLRQKAAESNRDHGGKEKQSDADMPPFETAESKGNKSEKKEREKEPDTSLNPLLGNMCSILLNTSISGADKTAIFTPLEFLTSDDLVRLYHLFVDTSATFKTASISVTDLEDYIVLKLQERGKSKAQAYAMLSSSRPSSSSSNLSSSNTIEKDRAGGGSGIVLPPLPNSSPSNLDYVASETDILLGEETPAVPTLPPMVWDNNPPSFSYNNPFGYFGSFSQPQSTGGNVSTTTTTATSSSSSSSSSSDNNTGSNNNGPG